MTLISTPLPLILPFACVHMHPARYPFNRSLQFLSGLSFPTGSPHHDAASPSRSEMNIPI